MKYKIDLFYDVDLDTTFRYDQNCKKLISTVTDGIIITVTEQDLAAVKNELESVLSAFSAYYGISPLLSTSFTVRVTELLGINMRMNAIITGSVIDGDINQVYQGPLSNLK